MLPVQPESHLLDQLSRDHGQSSAPRHLASRINWVRQRLPLSFQGSKAFNGGVEAPAAIPVERPEIEVLFLRTEDDPAAIGRGFERLETTIGLRGRKFFGAFFRRPASTGRASSRGKATTPPRSGWSRAGFPVAATSGRACAASRRSWTSRVRASSSTAGTTRSTCCSP